LSYEGDITGVARPFYLRANFQKINGTAERNKIHNVASFSHFRCFLKKYVNKQGSKTLNFVAGDKKF
jgi:hypothetical protein